MRIKTTVALLVLSFASAGCFEPTEGCLDINAVNYDFGADEECPDCCTYPTLSLDILHKIVLQDTTINLDLEDGLYTDAAGNSFQINSLSYYISNLHLVRSDGTEVGVEDQVDIAVTSQGGTSDTLVVEDNFALINPAEFGVDAIGTIREGETFRGLRFVVGIENPVHLADPGNFEPGASTLH